MCGTRLRVGGLSLLLLLLLSWPLYSDALSQLPQLPPGWYPISEAELTALETTLEAQAQTISELQILQDELTQVLTTQSATMKTLGTSFDGFVSAIHREIWTRNVVIVVVGAALIWSLIR